MAGYRSATQPSTKKVARTRSRSRMSRIRPVVATTRLSSVGQSSGRSTRAKASAWKYSSTSNVSAFFMRPDLGEQRLILLIRLREEPDGVREPGHDRHARGPPEKRCGQAPIGPCRRWLLRPRPGQARDDVGT